MKTNKKLFALFSAGALAAGFITGCSTPTIPISMDVAGEIKLTGVSKIAIAEFDTLPGDAFTGTLAADAETRQLVRKAVAASFYKSPMYQVCDLPIEKALNEKEKCSPKKRFDAVIYGRLWWQFTDVTAGQYPKVFTLEKWNNVPYNQKDPLTGKLIPMVAKVTTCKQDVIRMLDYRTRNATLMLTLAVYRLDGNGGLEKIVDTYQVTNEGFTLMNGEMKLDEVSVGIKDDSAVARLKATGKGDDAATAYEEMFAPKAPSLADVGNALGGLASGFGAAFADMGGQLIEAPKAPEPPKDGVKRDAQGKIILTQENVAMPTELQAKLLLASSVANTISAKLAPTKVEFDVPADLGDRKLENLLKEGALASAKDYALGELRRKLGKQVCETIAGEVAILGETAPEPPADSEEAFDDRDELIEYLADEDLDIYFYVLGICEESAGNLPEAYEAYRFAFDVKPDMAPALGISRVQLAMGESARVKESNKLRKKAEKKTKLD